MLVVLLGLRGATRGGGQKMVQGLKRLRIAVEDYPSLTPYLTHWLKTLCDTGYIAVLIDAQQVCKPHCCMGYC